MRAKKLKISIMKSWICRTSEGRKRLTKLHQGITADYKDDRKEEREWYK